MRYDFAKSSKEDEMKNSISLALAQECTEILRSIIADHPLLMKNDVLSDENESLMIMVKLQEAIAASDEIRFEYSKNEWGK